MSVQAGNVSGALQCAQMTAQNVRVDGDAFLGCTRMALVLDQDSMAVVNCAELAKGDTSSFGVCAGKALIGRRLSPQQNGVIQCAVQNSDDDDEFANCISPGLIGNNLTPQQSQVLVCAANDDIHSAEFADCAGKALLGDRYSPTAQTAVECAVQSKDSTEFAEDFASCATNKVLKANLTPEQQIGVQCVVSTGGQLYVAASCAAIRLTARELEKCINGFGGDGCFGHHNDGVGQDGFLVRNVDALAGGPNSFIHKPAGQAIPSGLRHIPSPPPIQVGKIGNQRVCVPWC